jgi:hypothetical protein
MGLNYAIATMIALIARNIDPYVSPLRKRRYDQSTLHAQAHHRRTLRALRNIVSHSFER